MTDTTPIDRLREQAEALVGALERILDEGPICFPEDKERCHCCEGTKEHGHADGCDWVLGRAALRAYRDWLTVGSPEAQQAEIAP